MSDPSGSGERSAAGSRGDRPPNLYPERPGLPAAPGPPGLLRRLGLVVVGAALAAAASAAHAWWVPPAVVTPAAQGAWTGLVVILTALVVMTGRVAGPWWGAVAVAVGTVIGTVAPELTGELGRGDGGIELVVLLLVGIASLIVAPAVFTAAVTGLVLLLRATAPGRWRPTVVVCAVVAAAWHGWIGWWAFEVPPPAAEAWLSAGLLLSLAVTVVVGDLLVRPWLGGLLVFATSAAVTAGPLAASDAQGAIGWFFLLVPLAAGCGAVSCLLAANSALTARTSRRRPARGVRRR